MDFNTNRKISNLGAASLGVMLFAVLASGVFGVSAVKNAAKESYLAQVTNSTSTPAPVPSPIPALPPHSVKILSPNGGETYRINDNLSIQLQVSDEVIQANPTFRFLLLREGRVLRLLRRASLSSLATSSPGVFVVGNVLRVTSQLPVSDQYQIMVTTYDAWYTSNWRLYEDLSDSKFSIVSRVIIITRPTSTPVLTPTPTQAPLPPSHSAPALTPNSVRVFSPNGGETYNVGDKPLVQVRFATNLIGRFSMINSKIWLLRNGNLFRILNNILNNTVIDNEVMNFMSDMSLPEDGNYKVMFRGYVRQGSRSIKLEDLSDGEFKVVPPPAPAPAPIPVQRPSGACVVYAGEPNFYFSSPDGGLGYGKKHKPGLNTISELVSACSREDYDYALRQYCSNTPASRDVYKGQRPVTFYLSGSPYQFGPAAGSPECPADIVRPPSPTPPTATSTATTTRQ